MTHYYPKRQATRRKNLIGVFLIAVIMILLFALFYFAYQSKQQQATIDPDSLCPTTAIPEYIAVIFDKTDAYNTTQQQFLKRFFADFKSGLSAGTQISLYVIDDRSRQEIMPDYVICAPRSGENANAFYENPDLIRKRWTERFEKPLDHAIQGFMQPGNANVSPIMEIFQVVSLSAFPVHDTVSKKRIILISDMLHHTSEWSHYRAQMDVKQLQKTRYYQRINTNLQGAEVTILYVRRDNQEHLQNKQHAYFWAEYINAIGGRIALIEKIDG